MTNLSLSGDNRWPNAVWAWEFLRRNQNYRADYRAKASKLPRSSVLPSGSHLIIGERRYRAARKWGLLFFANPNLPADKAALFWKPSLLSATIPVTLRTLDEERELGRLAHCPEEDLIILSEICCQRYIFESINGSRHVVLAPRRYWIQLYCDSTHPLGDKVLIYLRLEGSHHAFKRLSSFQQLLRLHKSSGRDVSSIGYRRNISPLSNAITALDIKESGGSYSDISRAINDPKVIETQKAAAKQKAVRALQRGELYRDGKYRELLS